jgi:biopolymer transport protein ExbD
MGRSKTKGAKEIDASSMADIAFLLLIFFLVTTTIDQDKGIIHKLPAWSEIPPPISNQNEREVLEILVNANNQLLVEQEYIDIDELRGITMKHLDNRGKLPQFSSSPQKAVISLKNDRGTNYGTYIEIQNELKAAYAELRDKYALSVTGGQMTFREIDDCAGNKDLDSKKIAYCDALKAKIQEEYPMKISEADPVNLGGK